MSAGLAAGVHDVPGLEPPLAARLVRVAHADGAVALEAARSSTRHPSRTSAPRRRGVLEQHLVELAGRHTWYAWG